MFHHTSNFQMEKEERAEEEGQVEGREVEEEKTGGAGCRRSVATKTLDFIIHHFMKLSLFEHEF